MKKIIDYTKTISLLSLSLFLFWNCNEELSTDIEKKELPVINDFSPKSGKVGSEIAITGENFQKIDKIWIGGGEAQLKYRVNSSQLIAVVTSECKTGTIEIANPEGKTQSIENFILTYAVPSITSYPETGSPNDEVLIEGDNLDAVTKVLFGTAKATILSQSEKELMVSVPYFEDSPADIVLEYFDGTGTKSISTTGKVFSITTEEMVVDSDYPVTAERGSSITLTGKNLTVIDEIWFGTHRAAITQKTESFINFTVPPDFEQQETVALKIIYFGTQELILTATFVVTVPVESTVYFWENRTLFCNDASTTDNFFDAQTGNIYTPCDYNLLKNNIHFFFTISSSSIQLNNPNNSGNATKLFKCGDEYLPTEKMPNIVKFRILNPSSAADNQWIQQVKNKSLTEISQEIWAASGAANATSNTPRYYGSGQTNQWEEGSVILFQQYDAAGTVLKVGFMDVLKITTNDPTTDKTSSVRFNCYFEK
jgi:hypothetical protein